MVVGREITSCSSRGVDVDTVTSSSCRVDLSGGGASHCLVYQHRYHAIHIASSPDNDALGSLPEIPSSIIPVPGRSRKSPKYDSSSESSECCVPLVEILTVCESGCPSDPADAPSNAGSEAAVEGFKDGLTAIDCWREGGSLKIRCLISLIARYGHASDICTPHTSRTKLKISIARRATVKHDPSMSASKERDSQVKPLLTSATRE